MLSNFFVHINETTIHMIQMGILETLYMTLGSTLIAYIIGLPVGVVLVITDKNGFYPIRWLNGVLNVVVNILRSIPFLILLFAIIPFTRLVAGTSIGSTATLVPLVVSAAPFVARVVEQSIKEVDGGVIEAAQSMGASPMTIICKVLLPEARPSLLVGSAIAVTTILGYSAMAGVAGGGGLGDIATRFGFIRYQKDIMLITVALLVIIVQILQGIGMYIAKIGDKRTIG
ncbi:methionine ABC transporter permease [Anaerovorax sp. IOR16]|uniref:methionine ABC transporter permease n=1 Tax=Anaerovorax sp. IOR16 TaxID=2773458 RepID=UPI002ED65A76